MRLTLAFLIIAITAFLVDARNLRGTHGKKLLPRHGNVFGDATNEQGAHEGKWKKNQAEVYDETTKSNLIVDARNLRGAHGKKILPRGKHGNLFGDTTGHGNHESVKLRKNQAEVYDETTTKSNLHVIVDAKNLRRTHGKKLLPRGRHGNVFGDKTTGQLNHEVNWGKTQAEAETTKSKQKERKISDEGEGEFSLNGFDKLRCIMKEVKRELNGEGKPWMLKELKTELNGEGKPWMLNKARRQFAGLGGQFRLKDFGIQGGDNNVENLAKENIQEKMRKVSADHADDEVLDALTDVAGILENAVLNQADLHATNAAASSGTVTHTQKPAASSGTVTQTQKPAAFSGTDTQTQKPAASWGTVTQTQKPAASSGTVTQTQKPAASSGTVTQTQKPAASSGTVTQTQKPAASSGTDTQSNSANSSGADMQSKPATSSDIFSGKPNAFHVRRRHFGKGKLVGNLVGNKP